MLIAGPARMADYSSIDLPAERGLDIKTTEAFGIYVRRIHTQLGVPLPPVGGVAWPLGRWR